MALAHPCVGRMAAHGHSSQPCVGRMAARGPSSPLCRENGYTCMAIAGVAGYVLTL